MCGRYTYRLSWREIVALYRLTAPRDAPNLQPRYNVAPTQKAPIVRRMPGGGHELALLRWGLVPSWSEGPVTKYTMINARAETVSRRPAFRGAFRQRRCLVPASGFYEWRSEHRRKQPYYFCRRDEGPMTFAGLWERWEPGNEGDPLESFTIIVTDANDLVRPVHDRMPVLLEPGAFDRWLEAEPEAAALLLRPYAGDDLVGYPVSRHINSPRNDDPACIEPIALSGTD